jgi:uncharacterized protein involved in outer membrane biogenesis
MLKPIIAGMLVLTGVVILAALNVNFLVERNRDYLLGRLAQTLGHTVKAGKIEISYLPLAIHMVNLAIAGDPDDVATPLVLARNSHIRLRVLPLILGQFQPGQISLDSPVVTIVRDADGRYNYEPQERNPQRAQDGTSRGEKVAKLHPVVCHPSPASCQWHAALPRSEERR